MRPEQPQVCGNQGGGTIKASGTMAMMMKKYIPMSAPVKVNAICAPHMKLQSTFEPVASMCRYKKVQIPTWYSDSTRVRIQEGEEQGSDHCLDHHWLSLIHTLKDGTWEGGLLVY